MTGSLINQEFNMQRTKINGLTFQEWLDSHYVALAGREEGDGSDGGDGGDEGAGSGSEGSGDEGGDGSGSGSDDGDGDDDGEFVRIPKAEAEKQRKELAAFKRKAAEAEKLTKKQREQQAAEEGRWKDLADEREKEKQEAEDKAAKAEFDLDQYKRQVRVVGLATKLGFMDPRDAVLHLSDDDTGDDKICEAALRKLAKDKKYLINPRVASGAASGGGGANGGLTMDQIKNMSQEEVNLRWKEVSEAMALNGAG